MTVNELKMIRSVLKPFIEGGLLSAGVMEEIATLTSADKPKDANRKIPEVMSRAEAAKFLGVSVRSIIRWGKIGKLRYTKLVEERLTRYKLSDIEALLTPE